MLKLFVFLLALAACAVTSGRAETIQLKDKAAVTGKVLAEKRDQVIVDLGFTVLAIPRSQIVMISKSDTTSSPPKREALLTVNVPATIAAVIAATTGFYSSSDKTAPDGNVRDLVNQIGEAVVQVRTPGGL